MATHNQCPLCDGPLEAPPTEDGEQGTTRLRCLNCGDHWFTSEVLHDLPGTARTAEIRARIAYGVRQRPKGELILNSLVQNLAEKLKLPSAVERLDNLVRHLAAFAPGQHCTLAAPHLRATIGTATTNEVRWLLQEALSLGLIKGRPAAPAGAYGGADVYGLDDATLAIEGWKWFNKLMRDGAGSRHAFMAMKFGDAEMDRAFGEFMRPAIAQTGFDLRTTVGDHQTAGSIDNRMRVEIRTSRFVLCDLTHSNQGAYWEAGFAEGLGRPVIYTCRGDVLDTPKAVHFDTAHQLIIRWDLTNIDAAMQELKATIRATLPGEARMEDNQADRSPVA